MIIDTSALVAVIAGEPEADHRSTRPRAVALTSY